MIHTLFLNHDASLNVSLFGYLFCDMEKGIPNPTSPTLRFFRIINSYTHVGTCAHSYLTPRSTSPFSQTFIYSDGTDNKAVMV